MIDTGAHGQALLEAAREHAEAAFAVLLQDTPAAVDLRTAALHAGAATEFLAKWRAWDINPLLVLILDKPEQRKAFIRQRGRLDEESLNQVHTLPASEVVELAAEAASVRKENLRADHVLSARNQAAHMAITPPRPHQLADDLAQVLRSLLPDTHTIDLEDFPDQEPFLRDPSLAENVSDLHGKVHEEIRSLITQARDRWERIKNSGTKKRIDGATFEEALEKKSMDHIQTTVGWSYPILPDLAECPVCHHKASAWFEGTDVLLDDYGRYDTSYEQVFSCGICELKFTARQFNAWKERVKPTLTEHPSVRDAENEWADQQGEQAFDREYALGVHLDQLEDDNS